ncbi:hypothetical protein FRC04_001800 [Tulasnella sp. 424]|nr:hypothetical protein FRC04_001800 [Tulasnella sp. 424]
MALTLFPFLGVSKSFPSSFVRSSSTESRSTTAETTTRVALPPWLRPHDDHDQLPRSLYPILPSPIPYIPVQSIAISRSSSNTGTDYDTAMTDAYYNDGESEDLDGVPLEATHPSFDNSTFQRDTTANYLNRRKDSVSELQDDDEKDNSELDYESEEETITIVEPVRTDSMKERKKALKAADAIKTRSKKTSVKNTKSRKSLKAAVASGIQNAPARRTRSSTRTQPAASQPASTPSGDEVIQPAKKPKTQKTWLPWERKLLRDALVSWWTVEGAGQYNHPTKMVLPGTKDYQAWDRISAKCKALNGSFNRARGGMYIIARSMKNDLPPVSVPGDSTAGLRRRK